MPMLATQELYGVPNGIHPIGCIFGEAAVDDFFDRGAILVVRQESGSTPVLMDNWNKSQKAEHRKGPPG